MMAFKTRAVLTTVFCLLFLSIFSLNAAAELRLVVELRYIGISHVMPRELETVIPVAPGDEWKEEYLNTIPKIVSDYYARRGFFSARVQIYTMDYSQAPQDKNRLTVVLKVEEGEPTLIRKFELEDPPGFKSKLSFLRFKNQLYEVAKIKPGDRFDQLAIADRMREVREWLVAQHYYLANTDIIQPTFSGDKKSVDVFAKVDYGDRLAFGFLGNTLFTKGELSEFIEQLRITGLGKDYIDAIKRKISEEYAALAYTSVKIEARPVEHEQFRHITFVIEEGKRTKLESLKWEGVSQSNLERIQTAFKNSSSRLIERGFYVERDVEKAIQLVVEDLQSRGYLSAKVMAKNIQPGIKPHSVRISVQISEGEQTYLDEIEITGATYFDRKKIIEILGVTEQKPFNPFALEEGVQKLLRAYVAEGFLDFQITTPETEIVTFGQKNRIAKVSLNVVEGNRIKIGNVTVEGLEKTRPYIVDREITMKTDDWWLGTTIDETERNIRRLGLFSEVIVRPLPSQKGSDYRDAVIKLREADPGAFEAGPGVRSDLGARVFGQISYSNLFGKHWIGAFSAEANRRPAPQYRFIEYKFDATFIEPRFFGTKNLYSTSISARKSRFPPNFNASSVQFTSGFERPIETSLSPMTLKLFYKLERIKQFDVVVNGISSPEDNQTMLIGSVVPAVTFDTRDSPFTTTKGQLTSFSLEYADPFLSAQSQNEATAAAYQKWTGSTKWYFSFDKIVWSNVLAGGWARSNIPGRPIPLIKLFRLGGYSTIRGFNEDSINVDNLSVKGTLTYVNLRTQFDLPFIGELRFAPFLDAGNLFIDNIFKGHPFLRAGAGAGLHYMTPVGPVNLDWGYKLNRVGNESPNQIHFSVGLI